MDRRDRSRYDRDSYDRDYSSGAGYSADDEHYHSARNLTNEFEQRYRSSHPEEERERRRNRDRNYDYDRFDRDRSRHESNYGHRDSRNDDYGSRQQNRGSSGNYSGSSQRSSDFDRDRGYENQNRNSSQGGYGSRGRYSDRDSSRYGNVERYSSRNQDDSNRYRSESGRYSNIERSGSRDSFDRQSSYGDRDRYSSQNRRNEDRRREGYGISDYDSMRDASPRSSRGVPNQGITSSFADDYGTDLERERRYGLSSGNFGGYGAHSGDYRRYRDDR